MSYKYQYKIDQYESEARYHEDVMPYRADNLMPIDGNYSYECDNLFERVLRLLLIGLLMLVQWPVLKIGCGFRCEGKEKIQELKHGGILISNHVHYLDCVMMHYIGGAHRTYHTGAAFNAKDNLTLPLFKALGFLPLNGTFQAQKNLMNFLQEKLNEGKFVHFYPEHALWMRYEKIRPFQPGAFKYAARFARPVVPVFIGWETTPLREVLGLKKRAVAQVLDPIYPDPNLSDRENVRYLSEQARKQMIRAYEEFYGKKMELGSR